MVLRALFHLRDPNIKVLEDYPQEIIERRRKQMLKLKEAKRNGMRVYFSKAEPDKLKARLISFKTVKFFSW